jgi:uncharacterized protein
MIGRNKQLQQINLLNKSTKSEFVAVVGRRRVGKTYLIDNGFLGQICFQISGIQGGNTKVQLENFDRILNLKTKKKNQQSKDWGEAFFNLRMYVEQFRNHKKKQVIFLDELPWMATSKSGCLQQLANFWNDYLSKQHNFILIICGSASSWLINNVTNDKGGLHNRLTDIIRVAPFTLTEVAEFFAFKNIKLTNIEIAKLYMTLGGIPYYLAEVRKSDTATTAISRICFSEEGKLRTEYNNLYKALFFNAAIHEKITAALAASQKGMLRLDILRKCKLTNNGSVARAIDELINCGFVITMQQYGKKKRDEVYRLNDEFTNFYHKFMIQQKLPSDTVWKEISQTQAYKIWLGYSYEYLVCKHIEAIKSKLGIIGIYSEASTYYYKMGQSNGMQIDLLLDRKDNTISYCEIKFTEDNYIIDKRKYQQLKDKLNCFKKENKIRKYVQTIFITNDIIVETSYSNEIVDANITLDNLFVK